MYDFNAPQPKALEGSSSRRSDPLVGRTFNGRFRIEARLAKGGMGKVYRAQQVPLGRAVALKVLNVAVAPEHVEAFHKRFFIEAATAARLSHPHTVTIFDYGCSDDGIYYIAMEYLEGQSLRALLNTQAPLTPRRAVTIAIQIARAVREAHGFGFMHRDLKPANVMLLEDDDGRDFAKVLDFGLAKSADAASDLTRTGQFLGSPGYMAPEQIRGAPLDARCDIYALGAILFEMLTGKPPFVRQGPMDTLMAHVHEEVPRFALVNKSLELPSALEAVVRMCLAKKPADRPQDMSALMGMLRQAVAHLPQLAPARAVALNEYEASGWAVVSPTGALRIQLGDDVADTMFEDAAADDALTLLGFDIPEDNAKDAPAAQWDAPSAPYDDAQATSFGAAIAKAPIGRDPELATLYFAPPEAPARTVIAAHCDMLAAVANDMPKPTSSKPTLARYMRLAVVGLVALLYTGPDSGDNDHAHHASTLHLRTDPEGAMVWHGDRLICKKTPCDVVWQPSEGASPAALRFFVDGYDEFFTNRYICNQEQTLAVTLLRSDVDATSDP